MLLIQIIIVLFILFIILGVISKFRKGNLNVIGLIFWLIIWIGAGVVILLPNVTQYLAGILGVGRGVDVIIYLSIVVVFYLIFRIGIKLEFIEHEITKIVRNMAIRDGKKK
jgi:hypothetical protein